LKKEVRVDYFIHNIKEVKHISAPVIRLLWRFRRIKIITVPLYSHGFHPDACGINYNPLTYEVRYMFFTDVPRTELHYNTILLHEMGHYMDFGNSVERMIKSDALGAGMELRAWKNAIRLSRQYGIEMDYNYAAHALSTYSKKSAALELLKNQKAA
jgi:hypothetical protein